MKLLSIITACSLGLLAAQAEAEGTVATHAQTIALQTGVTVIHRHASSITQTPGLSKARPDVATTPRGDAKGGMRQANTGSVVCHPCQDGGSKDCCAVGCD